MSSQALHISLLRPAVIHILRAAGFHSARPSVLDTLTDLCARYLLLVATQTAQQAYDRTLASCTTTNSSLSGLSDVPVDEVEISLQDVRLGLSAAAFFPTGMTASEEAWNEALRKPLSAYPPGARVREQRRRDVEDTRDVQGFVDWATGPVALEIRRIAGLLTEDETAGVHVGKPSAADEAVPEEKPVKEDYLTQLKKKHSKTGDVARYAGTTLGKTIEEPNAVKIEGGPATFADWRRDLKRKHSDGPGD